MRTTLRDVWMNLGWLITLVIVFAVPLTLDALGRLDYFSSLTMWALPVVYLFPLFFAVTSPGSGRRRRAVFWTVGSIFTLGIVLDFLLGHAILKFAGCLEPPPHYIAPCLPAIGGQIPIEEILFYALGPAAIVLAYACADELWLSRYNPRDDLLNAQLVRPSRALIITAVVAGLGCLVVWRVTGVFPTYAAFLSAAALLPAVFLYRCVSTLVNWPAFAVTTLYVLVTSLVWEVTLAIPRRWWGYEEDGILRHLTITAWSAPDAPFPIEAAFVWLGACFSSILIYEFTKAFLHHPRDTWTALFGERRSR